MQGSWTIIVCFAISCYYCKTCLFDSLSPFCYLLNMELFIHFGEQHDTQANAHHLLWVFVYNFCDVCDILVFMDFKED